MVGPRSRPRWRVSRACSMSFEVVIYAQSAHRKMAMTVAVNQLDNLLTYHLPARCVLLTERGPIGGEPCHRLVTVVPGRFVEDVAEVRVLAHVPGTVGGWPVLAGGSLHQVLVGRVRLGLLGLLGAHDA